VSPTGKKYQFISGMPVVEASLTLYRFFISTSFSGSN